jgi:hypothetical protein
VRTNANVCINTKTTAVGVGLHAFCSIAVVDPFVGKTVNCKTHLHSCVSRLLRLLAPLKPGNVHAVKNTGTTRLYCLTTMLPNEGFAALICAGVPELIDAEDYAALGWVKLT